jgi:hypothetical protein
MSALSLRIARPFAVAALLAVFGFAGSAPVRADEAVSPPTEEMILVSAKTMQTLEQRVIFLEETVAALTESWQHIDTHRMCAVDEDNGSQTCLTKSRLDALLQHDAHDTHAAVVNVVPQESAKADETEGKAEPVAPTESKQSDASDSEKSTTEIAAAETPASEPSDSAATVVSENSSPADPETTGSVAQAVTGAAVLSFPHVEIYEEPVAKSEE